MLALSKFFNQRRLISAWQARLVWIVWIWKDGSVYCLDLGELNNWIIFIRSDARTPSPHPTWPGRPSRGPVCNEQWLVPEWLKPGRKYISLWSMQIFCYLSMLNSEMFQNNNRAIIITIVLVVEASWQMYSSQIDVKGSIDNNVRGWIKNFGYFSCNFFFPFLPGAAGLSVLTRCDWLWL